MTTPNDRTPTGTPRGFRRVAPALVLFFMSPFVAEFLLGDFSLDAIWIILFVGPLYGGGALVVREVGRRLGRGWPTMLLLALAYGLFEEGIVIQTLFNPNYLGLHLLRHAYLPALGIGGWWTVFVLTLHTVWSISIPIAIVESLFAERRTTAWLGKIGLGVSALLLVGGGVLLRLGTARQEHFAASPLQLLTIWLLIAVLVVAACRRRTPLALRSGAVPRVWIAGLIALFWGLAFMNAIKVLDGWSLAGVQLALDVIAGVWLLSCARRTAWTPLHTVAVAGGAMLAYAYNGFSQEPVVGSKGAIDVIGNTIFAALAVALLALAVRNIRRHAPER